MNGWMQTANFMIMGCSAALLQGLVRQSEVGGRCCEAPVGRCQCRLGFWVWHSCCRTCLLAVQLPLDSLLESAP